MVVTMPRMVLSEFNTHRMFSRNSASSRAIPVEKRIAAVEVDPFVPHAFGKNKPGMQATESLDPAADMVARHHWLTAKSASVDAARQLAAVGVHKQLANRLLEPWLWHTIIVSATDWDNYFALRRSAEAQPEIQIPTEIMWEAYDSSIPMELDDEGWHLPLVQDTAELVAGGFTIPQIVKISAGRCCRVSYLTHEGIRDPRADIELCDRLLKSGHMSPLEHVARPMNDLELQCTKQYNVTFASGFKLHRVNMFPEIRTWSEACLGADGTDRVVKVEETYYSGNYNGWIQGRKLVADEENFGRVTSSVRDMRV
jgi:thymidylate synthase ThyX